MDVVWGLPDLTRTAESHSVQLAAKLSDAFSRAREAAQSYHRLMKADYDLGVVSKLFQVGQKVRVKQFEMQPGESKTFRRRWSEPTSSRQSEG